MISVHTKSFMTSKKLNTSTFTAIPFATDNSVFL